MNELGLEKIKAVLMLLMGDTDERTITTFSFHLNYLILPSFSWKRRKLHLLESSAAVSIAAITPLIGDTDERTIASFSFHLNYLILLSFSWKRRKPHLLCNRTALPMEANVAALALSVS